MPIYVYGCTEHEEQHIEVTHKMSENPIVPCPVCQKPMHRIPQPMRFYMNPTMLLYDKLDQRFAEYVREKKYGIKRKPNSRGVIFGD